MAPAKAFVNGLIAAQPVVCFSKTYCPYCVKAKAVLDSAVKGGRAGYTLVELDERDDGAEIQVRKRGGGGRGVRAGHAHAGG